jgi:hypothetical protein
MLMRERLYGGWLWILNMAVFGVSGVLTRFMGRMGWGSERILGGIGSCLATLDLRWGMALKFVFGMMFDVGLKHLRHLFRTCLALPVLRMLMWRTIWSFLVPPVSGLLTFSERLMIGR